MNGLQLLTFDLKKWIWKPHNMKPDETINNYTSKLGYQIGITCSSTPFKDQSLL